MSMDPDAALDRLWHEYSLVFGRFDDVTLARWMAQTLGQLQGRAWRFSHPLVGAYRLAAQVAHDRQIWLKRLANPPAAYPEGECCRAPRLPLLTREILESGLVCLHCSATLLPWEELPAELQSVVKPWAEAYAPVHAVAHWEEAERKAVRDYDDAFEQAARQAEQLLTRLGAEIAPLFLDHFPAVIWEDQDECLEVRPEDVPL